MLLSRHYYKLSKIWRLAFYRQTVAFLEVSAEEVERLKLMPDIVTHFKVGDLDGTYVLPPILYTDGKFYLKVKQLNKKSDFYEAS